MFPAVKLVEDDAAARRTRLVSRIISENALPTAVQGDVAQESGRQSAYRRRYRAAGSSAVRISGRLKRISPGEWSPALNPAAKKSLLKNASESLLYSENGKNGRWI